MTRARHLSEEIRKAWLSREESQDKDERYDARVLKLLTDTYAELRATVAYLRRNQGDVDSLCPKLYSRRKHKSRAKAVGTETPVTPVTTTPVTEPHAA